MRTTISAVSGGLYDREFLLGDFSFSPAFESAPCRKCLCQMSLVCFSSRKHLWLDIRGSHVNRLRMRTIVFAVSRGYIIEFFLGNFSCLPAFESAARSCLCPSGLSFLQLVKVTWTRLLIGISVYSRCLCEHYGKYYFQSVVVFNSWFDLRYTQCNTMRKWKMYDIIYCYWKISRTCSDPIVGNNRMKFQSTIHESTVFFGIYY